MHGGGGGTSVTNDNNENRIAATTVLNIEHSNNRVTNDINERVSELGVVPNDNNSPKVPSGRSGFETLTDLENPNGCGNSTAALQAHGRGTSVTNDNTTGSPLNIGYCVTKLYNILHLDYSALPFLLFLYHSSMDESIEPDVYIMTRAWYSVVPTGAQAAVAINLQS